MKTDQRKDLPPASASNFGDKVREALSTYLGNRGDPLDRGVTLRDLFGAGLVALRPGYLGGGGSNPIGGPGPNAGGKIETDLTPPPVPTGFTATAAISNILVECDAQTYTVGHGHGKSRLYGVTWTSGPLPTFADAVLLTEFNGPVFAYATNPATIWRLWLTWVTKDGVESTAPAGGINGLAVTTGQDVAKMVEAMTGPGNPFKIVSAPITLPDGSTVPAGTYTADAYIHNGQIVNAMIANLAVDDAKIASLSVSKLTAGTIGVGEYIQSTGYAPGSAGWNINGNGNAEFSGVIVRGTVYATAGQIGGNTIDASGMQSPGYSLGTNGWRLNSDGTGQIGALKVNAIDVRSANYAAGSTGFLLRYDGYLEASNVKLRGGLYGGAFTGYAWPAAGNYGFALDGNGLLLGNANNGKYVQITYDGQFYAPGLSIVNGVMTISQANVINTLNIAGDAVTVPRAATASSPINPGYGGVILTAPSCDPGSGAVVVTFSCLYRPGGGGTSSDTSGTVFYTKFSIRRNGSVIYTIQDTGPTPVFNFPPTKPASICIIDYPGAAAVYDVYMGTGSAPDTGTVYERSIVVLGAKR